MQGLCDKKQVFFHLTSTKDSKNVTGENGVGRSHSTLHLDSLRLCKTSDKLSELRRNLTRTTVFVMFSRFRPSPSGDVILQVVKVFAAHSKRV